MISHIYRVLRSPLAGIVWIISTGGLFFSWYTYSAIDYVAANYQSYLYAYTDTALSWGVILFLPLILAGIVYRSMLFGVRSDTTKPSGFFGILGGIVGVFVTGATCCGVTLISVLGMASLIGFLEILPYDGLELKMLGLSMLLYAWWDLYTNLEVCNIPKKSRPKKG